MRRDMPKVLVERPRWGWSRPFGDRVAEFERGTRDRHDPDVLASRMPMGFGRTRGLNENLAPLCRFLGRRVGRPWDAVYAELRATLTPRSAVDMHVLQHLYDFVLFTRKEGDAIWLYRHEGGAVGPLAGFRASERRLGRFYVCFQTGRLRRLPDTARPRAREDRP